MLFPDKTGLRTKRGIHRIFSSVSTFGEKPGIKTPEIPGDFSLDKLIFSDLLYKIIFHSIKYMPVTAPTESFYNRSLERALQILGAFSFETRELTLLELSSALSLSKSTVYRLASTLWRYGFLQHNEADKKYSLGPKLFELGGIVAASFSLRKTATPYLDELHSQLGKTVFLGIFQADEVVYVDKREDLRNPIRFASEIGTVRPPYFGMFGQLLMAFLPDEEVDRILKKDPLKALTKKSITSKKQFKKRLREIRRLGFCVDKEEAIDGITGIAAPIQNHNGKVVAALGVGFISSSEDSEGVRKIRKAICETTRRMSQELGSPQSR